MEIGYPTDVKHVAHIGWDSAAGNASPIWVNTPVFFFSPIVAITYCPNVWLVHLFSSLRYFAYPHR
jgi:hypothetical protein